MTIDEDAARVRRELEESGTSTVSLAGLDAKAAKKTKELLYAAAYAMGKKVKVRTDKAAESATGVLTDEAHVAAAGARKKAEPAPAAQTSKAAYEGGRLVDPKIGDRVQDANGRWYVYTGEGTGPFGTGYTLDSELAATNGVAQLSFDLPTAGQDEFEFYDMLEETGVDIPVMEPLTAEEEAQRQFDTQPKTSARRSRKEDRQFDTTQLRGATHGYYVHRDYAAHYFRWGWAARLVKSETKLLDVGCGQDMPLTRVLVYHNGIPKEMVCVDLNKITKPVNPAWCTTYEQFDFTADWKQVYDAHGLFDLISCFEIIEHMGVEDGDRLLYAMKNVLAPEGQLLLSTPVFNGKAAVNHVHEYTVDELAASIQRAGFRVLDRKGTFGSYHDVKKGVVEWFDRAAFARFPNETDRQAVGHLVLDFYEQLREFYADNVLACFMSPNLPDYARNNVWVLGHA